MRNTSRIGRAIHAACTLGATFTAGVALAFEPATLDEVVVTAQKRSERAQDIPMSLVALDAATLVDTGAQGFTDLAQRIPNLSFSQSSSGQFGSRTVAIRGVYGTGTTGFYVDDTPVPDSMDPRVVDLERVEVLRGPQGTLYGARSMGGTVRLITRQPDPTATSAEAHATLGSVAHGGTDYDVDGLLNLSVGGAAAIRMSVYQQGESGVFDRVPGLQPVLPTGIPMPTFAPHDRVDGQSITGGQVAGLLTFADGSVTVRPRVALQHWVSDGLPYADTTPGNFTQLRLFDLKEPGFEDFQHYSLTTTWHAHSGDLVSSTALFRSASSTSEDYSEAAILIFGIPPTPALMVEQRHLRRFVQEIRFASAPLGPLQFTAGLFYSNSFTNSTFPDNAIAGLDAMFGGAFGTDVVFGERADTTVRETAAFGELTWQIAPHLKTTLGLRAFDNKVDFSGSQNGIAVSSATFAGTQEDRKANPKASVMYEFSTGKSLYATAAEGFRVGGVNSFSDVLCQNDLAALGLTANQVRSYGSDSLWSYEVGLKTEREDHRATMNAAVFYIDWSKVQQLVALPGCGFGIGMNAGKARSEGAEFQLDAVLTEGLTISGGAGYTATRITDNGGISSITTGAPLPQVPKWTATASLDYRRSVFGHEVALPRSHVHLTYAA